MTDWRSQSSSLVMALEEDGFLKSEKVKQAFLETPRHLFVPENLRHLAYQDRPLSIGFGQTISAPHMVALMTEALEVLPGSRILEVGGGSGYQAAILAKVAYDGFIHSVERNRSLALKAAGLLESLGIENTIFHVGDGSTGLSRQSPFDRIIVTAAAPGIPETLVRQLAAAGILLAPTGSRDVQDLVRLRNDNEGVVTENLGSCRFVPLVGEEGW